VAGRSDGAHVFSFTLVAGIAGDSTRAEPGTFLLGRIFCPGVQPSVRSIALRSAYPAIPGLVVEELVEPSMPPTEASRERTEAGSAARERAKDVLERADLSLRSLARRLCRDASDADDLMQDLFVRVLTSGIPSTVVNPRGWLIKVLRRLFIDRCRRDARRPGHEPLDIHQELSTSPQIEGEPSWQDLCPNDLRRAAEQLPKVYREVYILHAFHKLSYEQIAAKESVDIITVGTRLTRARKLLRKLLLNQHDGGAL
jgi:RNA polymerase sigma-70 factor (ECF subfamily)